MMDTATETEELTNSVEGDGEAAQGAEDIKPLVLPSLEIKNFRAFKHLTVEKLGRVNLITGKNNVGKTSLLEALTVFSRGGTLRTLRGLLQVRGDLTIKRFSRSFSFLGDAATDENTDESMSDASRFLTLFYGRPNYGEHIAPIEIGEVDVYKPRLSISATTEESRSEYQPSLFSSKEQKIFSDLSLQVSFDYDEVSYEAEALRNPRHQLNDKAYRYRVANKIRSSQLITPSGLENMDLAHYWDDIALTVLEDQVIESLSVIAPNVERISFVGDRSNFRSRTPFAKVTNQSEPVPLKSLGDGANRLLGIIVYLFASSDGILLIDEIENGLHYSVLPQVWKLIFQTARRLNVQVFATTHSWDCIKAFQEAASEDDDPSSGVLVRLQNTNGDITSTIFDERRLAIVAYNDIEVR